MNNNFVPLTSCVRSGETIDELGFRAILGQSGMNVPGAGVIGRPRANPTANGLSIEDCCSAAIAEVLTAIIKDFGRELKARDAHPIVEALADCDSAEDRGRPSGFVRDGSWMELSAA